MMQHITIAIARSMHRVEPRLSAALGGALERGHELARKQEVREHVRRDRHVIPVGARRVRLHSATAGDDATRHSSRARGDDAIRSRDDLSARGYHNDKNVPRDPFTRRPLGAWILQL